MMPQDTPRNFKGSHVFLIFAAFFGIIIAVNGVFIYTALGTHTGVVTERPYEKGLAYNDTLEQAKAQPRWQTAAAYDNGVLTWRLLDEGAKPLDGAAVSAKLIRPVQDGNDFEVTLQPQGQGVYTTPLDLPMKGRWTAKLHAQWNDTQYQTTYRFTAK